MADVRLDRSDQHSDSSVASSVAEHAAERRRFDRIADRRARAVRFDVGDARRRDAGLRDSAARSIAAWPSTLGTVIDEVWPSWLTAVPRITA